MEPETREHTQTTSVRRRLTYPLHKVVAAVARSRLDEVVAALDAAGFAPERVEVVTAETVQGLRAPVGGPGFLGLLTRLELSLGDDFDELELARRELAHGHALVRVRVRGDGERERARAILGRHGGHAMRYFGRWTITYLDGGDADQPGDRNATAGAAPPR